MSNSAEYTKEIDHDPFGPSSIERRKYCPASAKAEEGMPKAKSDAASEGTLCHGATAARLLHDPLASFELNEEQEDAVSRAVEFAEDVSLILGNEPEYLIVEETLKLSDEDGKVVTFGTPDYAAIDLDGNAAVVNFKFGRADLRESAATMQIMEELAMVLQRTGGDMATGWMFCARTGEQPRAELAKEQIPAVIRAIKKIQEAANDPNAEYQTGPHCQYCRALGVCPATQDEAEKAVALVEDLGELTEKTVKAEIMSWHVDKIKAIVGKQKLLEWVAASIKSRALDILKQEPDAIPGWERKSMNGTRSCKEGPRAILECIDDLVSPGEVLESCTVRVADVEKAYVAKWREKHGEGKRGEIKAAKAAFVSATEGVVKQGQRHSLKRTKE